MEDWASYDPYGAEQMQTAIETGDATAVFYGVDGIALEKAVQEKYLLDGTFDAEAFATGEYVIAVGPAMGQEEAADGIPAPFVGSTVELDGVSYKVMAVTSVLDPVDKGSLEAGSEENRSSELCKFHGDGDRIPQKGICDDPERGNDEKAALPDAGF